MKRRIFALGMLGLAAASVLGGVGCSQREVQPDNSPAPVSDWVMPPVIDSVERTARRLTVRGTAAPQARVVLRGGGDTAYATGADDSGRFELKVDPPEVDTVFIVETQNGQDAAPASFRMLVSRDPEGPIALLMPGGASHRLDPSGPLGVIDSDGHALIVSGRAAPGAVIAVSAGGRTNGVKAGGDGRWSAVLTAEGASAQVITVDGVAYGYPGPGPGLSAGAGPNAARIDPAGAGRMVNWAIPFGAGQSSWFPND